MELLDVAGYTQPLKGSYTYEAYTSLEAFTTPPPERYVIFDGIDTVSNAPVLVELYRVKFRPVQSLGLIHAGAGALPMVGEVLFDPLNVDANGKGGFFPPDLQDGRLTWRKRSTALDPRAQCPRPRALRQRANWRSCIRIARFSSPACA